MAFKGSGGCGPCRGLYLGLLSNSTRFMAPSWKYFGSECESRAPMLWLTLDWNEKNINWSLFSFITGTGQLNDLIRPNAQGKKRWLNQIVLALNPVTYWDSFNLSMWARLHLSLDDYHSLRCMNREASWQGWGRGSLFKPTSCKTRQTKLWFTGCQLQIIEWNHSFKKKEEEFFGLIFYIFGRKLLGPPLLHF